MVHGRPYTFFRVHVRGSVLHLWEQLSQATDSTKHTANSLFQAAQIRLDSPILSDHFIPGYQCFSPAGFPFVCIIALHLAPPVSIKGTNPDLARDYVTEGTKVVQWLLGVACLVFW
jgi:hypothetical protein